MTERGHFRSPAVDPAGGKLVEQLGVAQLSESQISEMATYLDAQVEAFRNRPLDAGLSHPGFRAHPGA